MIFAIREAEAPWQLCQALVLDNEKETALQSLCKGCHEPINLITVANTKIVAKKPKETTNPTPESTASLRLL
jgi:hypothetical protein